MKLQEIFDQLSAGEFSKLNILGAGEAQINDANMDAVLAHINLGLNDLFGRFELRMNQLTLELTSGLTSYLLSSKHAVNGRRAVDPKYILDSVAAPFKDDVILVTRVLTDGGFELPLNRLDVPYSAMTSSANRLEIPLSITEKSLALPTNLITSNLTVHYRAKQPELNQYVGNFDPTRLDIELPYSHLNALCLFVAARVQAPIGLGQEFNASNTYATKYENECIRLKTDGHEVSQRGGEDRFSQRGFC